MSQPTEPTHIQDGPFPRDGPPPPELMFHQLLQTDMGQNDLETPGTTNDSHSDLSGLNDSQSTLESPGSSPSSSIDTSKVPNNYLAPPHPLYHAIKQSISRERLRGAFKSLKTKLTPRINVSPQINEANTKSFKEICFDLGQSGFIPENDGRAAMGLTELLLPIKLLDNTIFDLILPPTAGNVVNGSNSEVGDSEETQGSCERFIGMLPGSCREVSQKASPLGLVPKLLPYGFISTDARYVGSCFWMWLCIVDDLTENLSEEDWASTEHDLFLAFSTSDEERVYNDKDSNSLKVSLALREVIQTTSISDDPILEEKWKLSFMEAVKEVLVGFREERPLINKTNIPMSDWMRLRVITISTRPFFILARADLGLSPTVSKFGNPLADDFRPIAGIPSKKIGALRQVECLLQTILGLQNDILGWEKDFKTENPLSAIQVLIKEGTHPAIAMNEVVKVHNDLVVRCMKHAKFVQEHPDDHSRLYGTENDFPTQKSKKGPFGVFGVFGKDKTIHKREENLCRYLEIITGFANGMATWMAVSKRYIA